MSAAWPTAAAACFSGIERGRSGSRSRAIPVAMAPELTSTMRRPSRTAAMSWASAPIRASEAPAPGSVTRPVPTFTTRRRTRPRLRSFMAAERAVVVHAHGAERRLERREWVVRDLRPSRGQARHQRRLACVREADDADVGEELQLEVEPALGPGPAEVGAARGTVGRGGEPGVAAPAARAGDRQHALARQREVADERARVAGGGHGA